VNIHRYVLTIISPSLYSLILISFLAVGVILIGNIDAIYDKLDVVEEILLLKEYYGISIGQIVSGIDKLSLSPEIVTFIFWFSIGILFYSIFTAASNSYREIEGGVKITRHYVHPRNFMASRFRRNVLVIFIIRYVSILLLLLCFYYGINLILPYAIENSSLIINQGINVGAIIGTVLGFFMIVGIIQTIVSLIKLTLSSLHAVSQ
jgi:hypothetical protein